MRTITVMGRLGADPEVKATKSGVNYTTFRFANSEVSEKDEAGNPKTVWYSVTVWDGGLQNFCRYLKKGSSVVIVGDYSDRIYLSTKTGQNDIGRDIRATSIYFTPTSKHDDETEGHASAPVQAAAPKPQAKKAEETVIPQAAVDAVSDDIDDDLPF